MRIFLSNRSADPMWSPAGPQGGAYGAENQMLLASRTAYFLFAIDNSPIDNP